MKSRIADALKAVHPPIALLWSDERPEGAMQFAKDKWGCVMWLAAAAVRGKTAVCDRRTFGCVGGGVGLGFENQYKNFPGGEDCFCHFLSIGNAAWEKGRRAAEQVKPFMTQEAHDNFVKGEGYFKSPQHARRFVENLPITGIPARYAVFKPLKSVDAPVEIPRTVIFFVDPDRLSALVVLANYGRGDSENVYIPYAAGCQTIGIFTYREATAERPRAVVGLTDISARLAIRKQLGDNLLTFAMPYAMFLEMEANVEGSFLERDAWRNLLSYREPDKAPEPLKKS